MDSFALARTHPHDRLPSWVKDLVKVCAGLPEPVLVNIDTLSSAGDLTPAIELSVKTYLQACWDNSAKLIFRARNHDITRRRLQPYLKIPDPRHRHALTQLLLGDHPFAVEQLRRQRFSRHRIERHQRLCRFCTTAVEDEIHALFSCRSNYRLVVARERFLQTLFREEPNLRVFFRSSPAINFVDSLVNRAATLKPFAAYVYEVFQIFDEVPLLITVPSL